MRAGRLRERQPAVAGGERHAGGGGDGAGAEAVDDGTGHGGGDDGKAGDGADDEAGEADAEATDVVQIDDLEWHDAAPAEVVEEDPGFDDPDCRR
jgi:hypothetical protein